MACLFLISGCGPKLSVSKTVDVAPHQIRSIIIDAVSRTQTVTVEASSSVPFSVHIHLAGDEDEVDTAVMTNKESNKILAGQRNVSDASIKAEIPANKEGVVRFQAANEKASVSYTISN